MGNFTASVNRLPQVAAHEWESLQLYPELTLTAGLAGQRLLAKFDLVARTPDGRLVIFDWKTSQRRPKELPGGALADAPVSLPAGARRWVAQPGPAGCAAGRFDGLLVRRLPG